MYGSLENRNRLARAVIMVACSIAFACALAAAPSTAHADSLAATPLPESMALDLDTQAAGDYASTHANIYRLYNKWTCDHMYTTSLSEAKKIAKAGWQWEGIGWVAPTSGTPVYRLYNPYSDDHHYTTDKSEYDRCVKRGWQGENIGWYSDTADQKPLLRQFNPYAKTGTHNFTTSQEEDRDLVKKGWKSEGTAWYATNGNRIAIQPFWLRTPAWGKERLYWITSNGTFAKNRVVTAEEAGYMAWAGSNGVVPCNQTVQLDGKTYWADGRGELAVYSDKKMQVLARGAAELEACTKPSMTSEQKLRAAYNHIRDGFPEYKNQRIPHIKKVGWDVTYADDIFIKRAGNCFSSAAAMAYMAKAIGFESVCVCHMGYHGWTEIDGKVYDPERERYYPKHSYYGVGYSDPCDFAYKKILSMKEDWNRFEV